MLGRIWSPKLKRKKNSKNKFGNNIWRHSSRSSKFQVEKYLRLHHQRQREWTEEWSQQLEEYFFVNNDELELTKYEVFDEITVEYNSRDHH